MTLQVKMIDSSKTKGKDSTVDFDDVGHSDEAMKMMEEYLIGDLDSVHFRFFIHSTT